MSAADVSAYFDGRLGWMLGPPADAFAAMCAMGVDAVEEIHGVAENVAAGGLDEDARQVAFEWSVRIGSFIA